MSVRLAAIPTGMKAVAALLFAALFFFGMQAPAAHAAADIDLIVNVTSKLGAPLVGVNVYAYPVADHDVVPYETGTAADPVAGKPGRYAIAGLESGQQYTLYFDSPSTNTTAFDQFWGGTTWIEEATTGSWSSDSTVSVSLATNTTITGTVKNSSAKAIAGVDVYVERWDGSDWFPLWNTLQTTNSAGGYALRNLEAGTYAVGFAPDNRLGYLPEFAGNSPDAEHAAAVFVGLGGSAAVNATLDTGGAIAGSVDVPGVEDDGIVAWAYPLSDVATRTIDTSAIYVSNPTEANGAWTVKGLPTGSYLVKLTDPYYSEFPDRWSVGSATKSSATVYTVTAGVKKTAAKTTLAPVVELDVNLTIHDGGTPADDLTTSVFIFSADGEGFYTELSPAPYGTPLQGGGFNFPLLPPGSYNVWVDPGNPALAPSMTTQNVSAAAGADPWDIELDAASGFTFSTPPVMTAPSSSAGSTFSISVPVTTHPTAEPVSLSYMWLRDGAPIYGAATTNKRTYVASGVDVLHKISVLVRADTFGYAPIFTELVATNSVTAPAPAMATVPPSISAPAVVLPGSVLTANLGTWSASPLTFSVQWSRASDGDVLGTGARYTVRPEDANETIDMLVMTTGPGRSAVNAGAVNPVTVGYLTAPKATKSPVLTKKTLSGGVTRYSLAPGTWSPKITSFTYRWTLDGNLLTPPSSSGAYYDCTAVTCPAGQALEVQLATSKVGYAAAIKKYVARKGTAVPASDTLGGVESSAMPGVELGATDLIQYGQVLTSTPSGLTYPWASGGAVTRTYAWQRLTGTKWANISGASKATYTVGKADNGHQLRLRVNVASSLYAAATTEYFDAGEAKLKQDLLSSQPAFNVETANGRYGTLWIGRKTGDWAVSGVTQTYQWYSCKQLVVDCSVLTSSNWKAISKATSSTYTPPSSLNTYLIQFVVKGSKSGYETAVIRAPGPLVSGPVLSSDTIAYVTPPSIVGGLSADHATVGIKLTAKNGKTDVSGTTRLGRWQSCVESLCSEGDWTDIAGATGLTYTPAGDLRANPDVKVRYTEFASRPGVALTGQGSSAGYPLVDGTFAGTVAPKLTSVGSVYTISHGTWPAGTVVTHEWFIGDDPAGDAATFDTSTVASPSTPVTVVVSATRPGYLNPAPIRLAAKIAIPSTGGAALSGQYYLDTLSISGLMYGFELTDPKAKYKYQWYADGKAIKGQVGATIKPSSSYIGKKLTVRVTFTSPYFKQPSSYLTFPSITLAKQPSPAVTATVQSSTPGIYEPGSKLSVALGAFPSSTTLKYNWQRSTDNGATWTNKWRTTSNWVLGTYDGGSKFRVIVTGTKTGYSTMTATSMPISSDWHHLVTLGQPALTPTVAGAPVGTVLTVSAAYTTSGVTQLYSWLRNGRPVFGVTGTTWTPPAGAAGDEIQVRIAASKAGYDTVVFYTNTVQVGQAAPPVATTIPVISGFTGVPHAGDVLSATTGAWTVDGLQFTYQWMLDGTPAPNGTQIDFQVPAQTGKVITVTVSTIKTGWQVATSSSLPTAPIS